MWLAGLSGGLAVTLSLAVLTPVGLIFAMTSALPPGDLSLRHPGIRSNLRIHFGDLFDAKDAVVVITMNRRFDTKPRWVADDSLIGQFMRRYGGQPGASALVETEFFNRDEDAPVGDIVAHRDGNRGYLFLAVANRGVESRSTVVVDDIWHALNCLWQYARRNDIGKLAVPIIGTGFARAQIAHTLLLTVLLASYSTASAEIPVADLDVMVYPGDTDYGLVEFSRAYCDLLGYKIIDEEQITGRQIER